jgi:hypothetical protein
MPGGASALPAWAVPMSQGDPANPAIRLAAVRLCRVLLLHPIQRLTAMRGFQYIHKNTTSQAMFAAVAK